MTDNDGMTDMWPQRVPGAIETRLDDEVLLYVPATQEAVHLNAAATQIWDGCDGTASLDLLVTNDPHAIDVVAGLTRRGLLQGLSRETLDAHVSRSGFMRASMAVVGGTIAVPLLQSVNLPTALAASSGMPKTQASVDVAKVSHTAPASPPPTSAGVIRLPATGGNAAPGNKKLHP